LRGRDGRPRRSAGIRDATPERVTVLELPPRIDGYVIRRRLGEGGMGRVYLAVEIATRTRVAIKLIGGDQGDSPAARARFAAEIAAVERIDHPNVIRLRTSGTQDGAPYAVFDHVTGVDLQRIEAPLPGPIAAHLAWQLACALDAVHGAGLLHRDIKPANVMIGRTGWLTLIDFGVARQIGHADTEVVGTPRFLAPEVAAGQPASIQSDLYAFGVVVSRLLGVDAHTPVDLAAAPVRAAAPLIDVLGRSLAADPSDRPAAAAEIVATLAGLERSPARLRGRHREHHPGWPSAACERPTLRDQAFLGQTRGWDGR